MDVALREKVFALLDMWIVPTVDKGNDRGALRGSDASRQIFPVGEDGAQVNTKYSGGAGGHVSFVKAKKGAA